MFCWNINQRSQNNPIPCFVLEEIQKYNAGIVILTEYKENKKFEKKFKLLDYAIFTNSPQTKNEVLIAIKNDLINESSIPLVSSNLTLKLDNNLTPPNFLQVDWVDKYNRNISTIGIRPVTGKTAKDENSGYQFEMIRHHLQSINKNNYLIIGGDWNAVESYLKNCFDNLNIVTPSHDKKLYGTADFINNYSYLFTEYSTRIFSRGACLDHFMCSNNVSTIGKPLYSWEFLKHSNEYPKQKEIRKNQTQWDIPISYPDHAILTTKIQLI